MKIKSLAALLMLMVATFASGFQSATEWVRYTAVEGRYNVLLPQQPKLSTQEATTSSGKKLTQYLAQANDPDGLYWIGYFDYGADMDFSLDKARDGAVANVKGTLVKEEAISLGGYSGRDMKVTAKHEGIDLILRARIYDIRGRIYILQHLFQKLSDSQSTAQKTNRFFDSFKVTMAK